MFLDQCASWEFAPDCSLALEKNIESPYKPYLVLHAVCVSAKQYPIRFTLSIISSVNVSRMNKNKNKFKTFKL